MWVYLYVIFFNLPACGYEFVTRQAVKSFQTFDKIKFCRDLDVVGKISDVDYDDNPSLVPLDLVDHRRCEIRPEVPESVIFGLSLVGRHLDADQVGRKWKRCTRRRISGGKLGSRQFEVEVEYLLRRAG